MKNLLIASLLTLFVTASYGQNFIENNFADLKAEENATNLVIKGKMFELLADVEIETEDEKINELANLVDKMEEFRLLVLEKDTRARSLFAEARNSLSDYEEILEFQEEDDHFVFAIQESKDLIREIVMVGRDDNTFITMSLTGWLTMEDINKVVKELEIDGMEHLQKLGDEEVHSFKVFPNPAAVSSSVTVQVPKTLVGQQLDIRSAQGKVVMTRTIDATEMTVSLSTLSQGNYILTVNKEGTQYRKKLIVIQ